MSFEEKDPMIKQICHSILGTDVDIGACIKNNICAVCGGKAYRFRHPASVKEFEISGMCQKCQDVIFGAD